MSLLGRYTQKSIESWFSQTSDVIVVQARKILRKIFFETTDDVQENIIVYVYIKVCIICVIFLLVYIVN